MERAVMIEGEAIANIPIGMMRAIVLHRRLQLVIKLVGSGGHFLSAAAERLNLFRRQSSLPDGHMIDEAVEAPLGFAVGIRFAANQTGHRIILPQRPHHKVFVVPLSVDKQPHFRRRKRQSHRAKRSHRQDRRAYEPPALCCFASFPSPRLKSIPLAGSAA